MTITTGMFNHYMNPEKLRKKSFSTTIARIFPNGSAPLFALTGQAGRAQAAQIEHGYFSKTWEFKTMSFAAANDSADTLTAHTGSDTRGVLEKQIFYNTTTREIIRVTTVPSTTSLTVERGFGSSPAAAITTAHNWVQIGTAFEQGSGRPAPRSIQTRYFSNYTQIWRNAWALTDTARASMNEMGYDDVADNRRDCSMFHSQDMELSMIFGQKSLDTSGATPLHTTQGLVDAIHEYAPSNVLAAPTSNFNFSALEDLLVPAFEFNTTASSAMDRLLFTGSVGNKTLNEIGRNHANAEMTLDQTEMGMVFTTIKTYKGRVHIVEHPIFNGVNLEDMALVLDIPSIKMAYLNGRDTKAEEFGVGGAALSKQGIDAIGGSLTTEAAVEFLSPFSCCVINGLDPSAVS